MANYKTIYLMRHAEAEPYQDDDHARNLTAKGIEQADSIAKQLVAYNINPGRFLISDANRTVQTFKRLKAVLWAQMPDVTYKANLYNVKLSGLLRELDNLPDDCAEAILVGHNPSVSDALSQLLGREMPPHGLAEVVALRFPTLAPDEPWVSALSAQPNVLWHLKPQV